MFCFVSSFCIFFRYTIIVIVAVAKNSTKVSVVGISGIGVGLSWTVTVVPSVEITMVPETWVP